MEQTKNQVTAVQIVEGRTIYFAITSNFIKTLDSCRNCVVIMMGCNGLNKTDMAKAFIEKGANAYISWDGPVSQEHTDNATDQLICNLISKNQTIGEAINNTMNSVGSDPHYHSRLAYYPPEAENRTVTKTSKTTNVSTFYGMLFFRILRAFLLLYFSPFATTFGPQENDNYDYCYDDY